MSNKGGWEKKRKTSLYLHGKVVDECRILGLNCSEICNSALLRELLTAQALKSWEKNQRQLFIKEINAGVTDRPRRNSHEKNY